MNEEPRLPWLKAMQDVEEPDNLIACTSLEVPEERYHDLTKSQFKKLKKMHILALYDFDYSIKFVKFKTFANNATRQAYIDALNENSMLRCHSDTDPFLDAFKIPEELYRAAELDDSMYDKIDQILEGTIIL